MPFFFCVLLDSKKTGRFIGHVAYRIGNYNTHAHVNVLNQIYWKKFQYLISCQYTHIALPNFGIKHFFLWSVLVIIKFCTSHSFFLFNVTDAPFVYCISIIKYGHFIFNYSSRNQKTGIWLFANALIIFCVCIEKTNVWFSIDNCLIYILIKKKCHWFPDTSALLLSA